LIKKEDEFAERSHNKFFQMGKDFIEVCPECKSTNISIRNRKKPKYKCQDCGNEFADPKAKIVNKTQKERNDFGRQYSNPDE
jgi:transposase-like protein